MRIAFHLDTPFGAPTGIGRYTTELYRSLSERGNSLQSWTRWRWKKKDPARKGLHSRARPLLSTWKYVDFVLPPVYGAIDRTELIHSPNGNLLPFTGGIPQTIMVHDMAIFMFRDIKPEREVSEWKTKIDTAVRKSAGILVNSETTAADLIECFPDSSGKVHVTKLGIDHLTFPSAELERRYDHILAVGTVEPRKNYGNLLRGYEYAGSLLGEIPPLVIAGGMGYRSREIVSYAMSSDLGRRIRFTGYVNEEQLRSLYSAACCLVHPAVYEGFGFTVPEALGFGLPVVSSNTGSLGELFSDAVYPVDPKDPESIGNGIIEALSGGMSQKQRLASVALFESLTWSRCAEETEKAFSRIVG